MLFFFFLWNRNFVGDFFRVWSGNWSLIYQLHLALFTRFEEIWKIIDLTGIFLLFRLKGMAMKRSLLIANKILNEWMLKNDKIAFISWFFSRIRSLLNFPASLQRKCFWIHFNFWFIFELKVILRVFILLSNFC
jgi:hypothetical protein